MYFARAVRPELAFTRMPDVLLYAPAFVRDNLAIGRDVALTEHAREELTGAYGSLFTISQDARVAVPTLVDLTRDLPRGTPYVLSVLKPTSEFIRHHKDFSTDFTHTYKSGALKKQITESGQLLIKKPGNMR